MFAQPFVRPCPIAKIDCRVRVLLCFMLSCTVATLQELSALLCALSFALLLLSAARPPLRALLARLWPVNLFLLFLWLITPWTHPGTTVLSIAGLNITAEGLWLTTLVSLKANIIVCFFIACISTMDISDLGHALHALFVPAKLIFLLLFATRSIHLLFAEWQTLKNSAKLRCFSPKTNLHTYRTLAALLGILLLRALDQSRRSSEALLLRNFTGIFLSTRSSTCTKWDLCVALLGLLAVLLLVYVNAFSLSVLFSEAA